MTDISLKLRIVTPMFISGAEQQEQQAELREPSIKGLLRFWYRVIYPDDRLGEARIFGGQGKGQGQSRVILRISEKKLTYGDKGDVHWDGTKTAYLGYGVINREETGNIIREKNGTKRKEKKDMTSRPYIKSGSRFTLNVLFKPFPKNTRDDDLTIFQNDEQRVRMALWTWLMFGGLGARSRKGFGSLIVESATGMDDMATLMAANPIDLLESIKQVITKIPPLPSSRGYPNYTRWSKDARCFITEQGANGEAVLENLGQKIHSLRSHRSPHKLSWVTADHDLISDFIHNKINPALPPVRSAFGLPHNYFFSSTKASGEVNLMDGNNKGRRASPVFFHIHEFTDNRNRKTACVVALFLPAELIPANKKVTISTGKMANATYRGIDRNLSNNFKAVMDVLDKLEQSGSSMMRAYP